MPRLRQEQGHAPGHLHRRVSAGCCVTNFGRHWSTDESWRSNTAKPTERLNGSAHAGQEAYWASKIRHTGREVHRDLGRQAPAAGVIDVPISFSRPEVGWSQCTILARRSCLGREGGEEFAKDAGGNGIRATRDYEGTTGRRPAHAGISDTCCASSDHQRSNPWMAKVQVEREARKPYVSSLWNKDKDVGDMFRPSPVQTGDSVPPNSVARDMAVARLQFRMLAVPEALQAVKLCNEMALKLQAMMLCAGGQGTGTTGTVMRTCPSGLVQSAQWRTATLLILGMLPDAGPRATCSLRRSDDADMCEQWLARHLEQSLAGTSCHAFWSKYGRARDRTALCHLPCANSSPSQGGVLPWSDMSLGCKLGEAETGQ